MHLVFLAALDEGTIPAGKDAQKLLYRPNAHEEQDLADLLEDLSRASSTYIAADFEMDRVSRPT